jgi:hypothetical protein
MKGFLEELGKEQEGGALIETLCMISLLPYGS